MIFFCNWLILFFSCKIIFFSWIQQFCIFSSEREPNGNIKQSMQFDGTFMQMNFWKTSSHIIFVIRRAILHQVQVLEKWWFTLLEHQNPISRDGKIFLRSPLFFTSDDNCLLAKSPTHFFAYQQRKFSDFTHFLFWKFFWTVQCGLLILRQISLGYLHSTKCVLEGC